MAKLGGGKNGFMHKITLKGLARLTGTRIFELITKGAAPFGPP